MKGLFAVKRSMFSFISLCVTEGLFPSEYVLVLSQAAQAAILKYHNNNNNNGILITHHRMKMNYNVFYN